MAPQFLNAVAGHRGALFLPQVFADQVMAFREKAARSQQPVRDNPEFTASIPYSYLRMR
jgi:hypothetical protein